MSAAAFARAMRHGGAAGQVMPPTRLRGLMPWIIAIMVTLTVLAAGGALALTNFAERTQVGLEGGLTVQIIEPDPASRDAQIRAATALLEGHRGVAQVRVVPEDELARLVEPWLGDTADSAAVTLPALIDVRLGTAVDEATLAKLRATLASAAPSARLDRQADWLGPIFDTIRALRWLSLALIALLMLASASAVWLAARNALDANRGTIEIIHHLGADDAQIARIFQRSVLFDAALGGAVGLAFGSMTLLVLGARFSALQSGLVDSGSFGPRAWALIALVPVLITVVALVTARRTVMTRLGRML